MAPSAQHPDFWQMAPAPILDATRPKSGKPHNEKDFSLNYTLDFGLGPIDGFQERDGIPRGVAGNWRQPPKPPVQGMAPSSHLRNIEQMALAPTPGSRGGKFTETV